MTSHLVLPASVQASMQKAQERGQRSFIISKGLVVGVCVASAMVLMLADRPRPVLTELAESGASEWASIEAQAQDLQKPLSGKDAAMLELPSAEPAEPFKRRDQGKKEGPFIHTRGYQETENVFDSGYKKPILGHWIQTADGQDQWMTGKQYVATFGTDDPTNGQFLGKTKQQIREAPSLVGAFGIDSNVFSSSYKAPADQDHIGVAMVHADGQGPTNDWAKGKDASKKIASKEQPNSQKKAQTVSQEEAAARRKEKKELKSSEKISLKAQLESARKARTTLLSENVFDGDYKKPLEGHWVEASGSHAGEMMWVSGEEYAAGGYHRPSHKPRIVSPGPSMVSAFGIDSNIFASNYQKPKAFSHHDHIGVAMVHVDGPAPTNEWNAGSKPYYT